MAIIEMIWEPEKQIETVYVFAPKFYERCFPLALLDTSEEWTSAGCGLNTSRTSGRRSRMLSGSLSLKSLTPSTLCPLGDCRCRWGEHMSDSFRWLWRLITESLTSELEALQNGRNDLVMADWENLKSCCDEEVCSTLLEDTRQWYDLIAVWSLQRLGALFWKHLNDVSPEQTHLFRRSIKMWGLLLHHIVNMLLLSITDPQDFFEQLFHLTIRHIRYGVRSEYISPFGQAMILTLEEHVSRVEHGRERNYPRAGGGKRRIAANLYCLRSPQCQGEVVVSGRSDVTLLVDKKNAAMVLLDDICCDVICVAGGDADTVEEFDCGTFNVVKSWTMMNDAEDGEDGALIVRPG
eukprot:768729-Hanusia_phi.AAC.3